MTNMIALIVSMLINGQTIEATETTQVVTNITKTAYDPGALINFNGGWLGVPLTETEKWEVSKIEEKHILEFAWRGQTNRVEQANIVSITTNHLRIKQEWETVK